MSLTQEKHRSRVDEILSKIAFLGDINDLFNGYYFRGETRRGRYFEVTGYPPDNVKLSVYDNEKSDEPTYEVTLKVSRDDEGLREVAKTLHEVVEKELRDRLKSVQIAG